MAEETRKPSSSNFSIAARASAQPRAFVKISDPKVRKSVVDLGRALSASADN
jgi:hypothetical protein